MEVKKLQMTFDRVGKDIVVKNRYNEGEEYTAFRDKEGRFKEWLSVALFHTLKIYLTEDFFKNPGKVHIEMLLTKEVE